MKIGIKTLMALAMGLMTAGSSVGLAADAKSSPLKNKATSTKAVGATPKNAKDTENVSYLFVLQAQQGTLAKNKDGQWILTLKHKDVNNVIEFSDRPYRYVKYISATDLKKLWGTGTNSFESDPPNAVLTAQGQKAQIIVLKGMTVDHATVSYIIHLTDRAIGSINKSSLANITLVTDGHVHTIIGAPPRCDYTCETLDGGVSYIRC